MRARTVTVVAVVAVTALTLTGCGSQLDTAPQDDSNVIQAKIMMSAWDECRYNGGDFKAWTVEETGELRWSCTNG